MKQLFSCHLPGLCSKITKIVETSLPGVSGKQALFHYGKIHPKLSWIYLLNQLNRMMRSRSSVGAPIPHRLNPAGSSCWWEKRCHPGEPSVLHPKSVIHWRRMRDINLPPTRLQTLAKELFEEGKTKVKIHVWLHTERQRVAVQCTTRWWEAEPLSEKIAKKKSWIFYLKDFKMTARLHLPIHEKFLRSSDEKPKTNIVHRRGTSLRSSIMKGEKLDSSVSKHLQRHH